MCNTRLDIVCGSDGVTYSNPCNLNAIACQTGFDVQIASKGKCRPVIEALEAELEDGEFFYCFSFTYIEDASTVLGTNLHFVIWAFSVKS